MESKPSTVSINETNNTSTTKPTLLDTIINELSKLPGKRKFTPAILVSEPQPNAISTVFPYTLPSISTNTPSYEQHILIFVAESSPTSPDEQVFVSAIDLTLYIFPTTQSCIVYISKVDSTGQGIAPSPVRAPILGFLNHLRLHVFPGWHIWLHLFARAQNQYLFPASIEYEGKKVLSDAGLVKWWKSVLDEYVRIANMDHEATVVHPYVILPGATDDEAMHLLKMPLRRQGELGKGEWIYGHPYVSAAGSLPLSKITDAFSLATLIPVFDDDPKARFLAELLTVPDAPSTTTATSGALNVAEVPDEAEEVTEGEPPKKKRKLDDKESNEPKHPNSNVSVEEFWERMAFRQESRLGAVVAFFVVHTNPGTLNSEETPLDNTNTIKVFPEPHVSIQIYKAILHLLNSIDFGTTPKAIKSTGTVLSALRAKGEYEQTIFESSVSRTIEVDNPPFVKKQVETPQPQVTVLAVRKKPKKQPIAPVVNN